MTGYTCVWSFTSPGIDIIQIGPNAYTMNRSTFPYDVYKLY